MIQSTKLVKSLKAFDSALVSKSCYACTEYRTLKQVLLAKVLLGGFTRVVEADLPSWEK